MESPGRRDTLRVFLPDSVDLSHAPIPTNDSERLLFRQLYQTLVHVDCRGNVRPGLAVAWTRSPDGRAWTFILREGVRSADGAPVSPSHIVASWKARPGAVEALGIDSAVALDNRRLAVTVRALQDSGPRLFAEPALALTHPVEATSRTSVGIVTPGSDNLTAFTFEIGRPNADPRDALDRGADLAVTGDPTLVDYAVRRPELATFPLPWSRTYVLLQATAAEPIAGAFGVDSLRQSLARDAVQAEARPAEPPFWWDSGQPCQTDRSTEVTLPTLPRIVYPRGDEVARRLAERIVALSSGKVQLRTAALAGPEFAAAAFRTRGDRGYVVSLPREVLEPCHETAMLPADSRIQPLIDTRARAILRRGSPTFTVDWDGTLRLEHDQAAGKDLP